MSFRLTAALLVLLAALGVVVWFTEFKDKESPTSATPDRQKLEMLKLDDREVASLAVAKGDLRLELSRDDQGGWIIQPDGQSADRIRVSSVLFRLTGLQAQRRVVDETTDLAQYGLERPALKALVTMKDGSAHTLLLGTKAPSETAGTYAQIDGSPVIYLVSNQLVTDLERMTTEPPIPLPTLSPPPVPSPAQLPAPSPSPG